MTVKFFQNSRNIKALALVLELLFIGLAVYLVFMPFYPEIKYRVSSSVKIDNQDVAQVTAQVQEIKSRLPESEYAVSPNRLIIPKIGVNAPVVVTDNEVYGLSLGAWLDPKGSTPDQGGNTVITGHRFKYLPPNNITFYLFHKLVPGDTFSVVWEGEDYYYRVKEIKIVEPSDASPYNESEEAILTMYTCHPIYSTEKRLVVISEQILTE